jgi:hypothetical protein
MYGGPPGEIGPCTTPARCVFAAVSNGLAAAASLMGFLSDGSRNSTTPSGWITETTPSAPMSSVRKNVRYISGSTVATTMPSNRPSRAVSGRPSGMRYCFGSLTVRNGRSTTSSSMPPGESRL